MNIHPILIVIAFLPHLTLSATSIRCQCTKAYSGIPCYHGWCEVRSNATHIAACALAKKNGSNSQTLACALVTERADEGKCQYDGKRNFTKCWCTRGDYCNVDLVDRIRDKRDDEEDDYDDFTVETNTEFNENNNNIESEEDIDESQEFRAIPPGSVMPERIDAVDMRKPVMAKNPDPEDESLPPWRRMNPLNADREWKPPPPPPMPGKLPIVPPTTTTSTTTTTTTTKTTTTAPPTTTTTGLSYEERMRQYEERRRQIEQQREAEMKRRTEVERQRMEERRHLESQHEQRRKFGEETRNWPAAPVAPETTAPTTTTTTRTTPTSTTTITTTSTTTTTTAPPTTTTATTTSRTTTSRPVNVAKEEKSYESYYRNWKPHRRPLDLNPTQVSIQSVSAIVYPPKNFVKATKSTPSTITTLPPTTTTQETTTTTQPIIYPPANFRKANKGTSITTTTTTTTPKTTTTTELPFTLPMNDNEDDDDEELHKTERKMIEMPKIESDEVEPNAMYTPRPPQNRPAPPTPSVRTPAEKMDEYKKILAEEPSSSASSIILPSVISIIILFLL